LAMEFLYEFGFVYTETHYYNTLFYLVVIAILNTITLIRLR